MDRKSTQIVVATWLLVAIAVSSAMAWYSTKPGAVGELAEVSAVEAQEGWQLDLFVHPKCPCSHATVSELERLLASVGPGMSCTLYAFAPKEDPDFAKTSLIARARQIPRVVVMLDEEGLLAESAGATVSGACILYDPSGEPRFIGGLTPSRGHEGDSVGKQSIMALLGGKTVLQTEVPTYGCDIVNGGRDAIR